MPVDNEISFPTDCVVDGFNWMWGELPDVDFEPIFPRVYFAAVDADVAVFRAPQMTDQTFDLSRRRVRLLIWIVPIVKMESISRTLRYVLINTIFQAS